MRPPTHTAPAHTAAPPYVELLAKTCFSFLQAASQPEEMIQSAHSASYQGIGIADCDGFYGSVRAHLEAEKLGLPLCHGAEVLVELPPEEAHANPRPLRLFLIAKNREGYGDLCELLSQGHQAIPADTTDPHPRARLTARALLATCRNVICIIPVPVDNAPNFEHSVASFKDAFGNRLYLAASQFLDGYSTIEKAEQLSKALQLDVIATNEPLHHIPERKSLLDVLTCIHHGTSLAQAGQRLVPNAERYLKTPAQMAQLFRNHPEWLANTVRIFEQCAFSLSELKYRYPTEWIPQGFTTDSYLEHLVWEGATNRAQGPVPESLRTQLQRELALIQELEYSDYFLTIWDIVHFARGRGILCQGRGSAANSSVCFVLGITSIDPVRMDLLFERFISRERKEPPDIDIDFEHERREEVIQYIYERYGRHRAAITAEVICFRRRSALREVGKVFELPEPVVERFLTLTHRLKREEIALLDFSREAPNIPSAKLHQYLLHAQDIQSFPRHIGTHVGGFVLAQEQLTRNVPVEKAAMPDRTIVQWDKNDLDALGFVRVDILGLGILSCIRGCFEILDKQFGRPLTLATLPAEDPKVYEQIGRGDTVGIFQIESRAQMNMLPRLRPKNFFDLVVEISLVRPGPIQGKMVHPYLKRRAGEEPVHYAHPDLEPILKKTFGVPIFQEQVMKMAMRVAGFTGGEADELRRAMGTWRRSEQGLLSLKDRFEKGLIAKGVSSQYAENIFSQIQGFAEYGFPESHAASFAILVYATAWLRHHYPDVYLTAILNAQPMGFYSKRTLIHDAERHGVTVLPVDLQKSTWHNQLETPKHVRLGYREISGFHKSVGEAIERNRHEEGPYLELIDFVERVSRTLFPRPLTKRDLFLLASAHAFESLGLSRRETLWKIQGLHLPDSPWRTSQAFQPVDPEVKLPLEEDWERIVLDYEAQSVCLTDHPIGYLRPLLDERHIYSTRKLLEAPHGKRTTLSGMVICRQMPPTAKGVFFVTLEDEWGFANLIVWNDVFNQHRTALLENSFLTVTGTVQRSAHGKVVNFIVESAEPLLPQLPSLSRDFH